MTETKKSPWLSPWIYLSSFLVILAGSWFLFKGKTIPFRELQQALSRFQIGWVALALGAICVQVFWQICRLWILVPPKDHVGFCRIAQVFIWGQFINSFAPARAGDFVKAISLSNQKHGTHVSLPEAAAVLIADKVVDAASLLLLCSITSASHLKSLPELRFIPWTRLALIAAGLLLLVGLLLVLPAFRNTTVHLRRKWRNSLRAFFKNPYRLMLALGFSVLCWTFESLAVALLCQGQQSPISFPSAVFVLLTLNLGIAIPIAVANVGAFEAAMTFGLARAGLAAPAGLAVATVHHAFQIAGIVLWLGGLKFSAWLTSKPRNAKTTL